MFWLGFFIPFAADVFFHRANGHRAPWFAPPLYI
jgi:hypothetical protein